MTSKDEAEKWPADEHHWCSDLYERMSWEEALERLEDAADDFYTGNQCRWFGDKVRARIAELVAKVPRWIPVTERLPQENNEPVQVILIQQGYPDHQVVVPAYFGMGHFFRYARDEGLDWSKPIESHWVVTHWMPQAALPDKTA